MPYVIIEDFRAGLDRRKLPAASPQGSLQELKNAHITRGGEIEKRLSFVRAYDLPAGKTFGLAGANGELMTFGSVPTPAGMPAGITYKQLAFGANVMTRAVCTEFFDGKPFTIADFGSSKRAVFYDTTRLTDFDSASGAVNVQGSKPAFALTHKEKVYVIQSSILAFSGIQQPTKFWDTADPPTIVGFGFKNMSNQSAGSEALTAMGRYQSLMAVFARRNIQIWYLDPDPLQNAQRQVLENIGTFAPKSVVPFGDVDVFFLSDSGVRSLRARDSSNQSGVNDVGTPIDDYLLQYMATLTDAQKVGAVGILEPVNGRYVLFVGQRAFVFSYFSTSRISAWSTYELPFQVSDAVVLDGRVYVRAGDAVYLLGGLDGATFGSDKVEVQLPYIDGRQIATFKNFTAIDVVCEGEWTIYANTDPGNPEAETKIATVSGTTLTQDGIGMVGHSPVISLRLVNEAPGPARLSKIIVHYQGAEAS